MTVPSAGPIMPRRFRLPPEVLILALLAAMAIAARVLGRNFETGDIDTFSDWYTQLKSAGGVSGLSEEVGN